MLLKKQIEFQEICSNFILFSYSNALIITYCENEDDYRFSLITSELNWITDNKIKKIFQIPRLSLLGQFKNTYQQNN